MFIILISNSYYHYYHYYYYYQCYYHYCLLIMHFDIPGAEARSLTTASAVLLLLLLLLLLLVLLLLSLLLSLLLLLLVVWLSRLHRLRVGEVVDLADLVFRRLLFRCLFAGSSYYSYFVRLSYVSLLLFRCFRMIFIFLFILFFSDFLIIS